MPNNFTDVRSHGELGDQKSHLKSDFKSMCSVAMETLSRFVISSTQVPTDLSEANNKVIDNYRSIDGHSGTNNKVVDINGVRDLERETTTVEDTFEETNGLSNSSRSANVDLDEIHKLRMKDLLSKCENFAAANKSVFYGKYSARFYYSKSYDFAYCKVPKVGSTFWTQLFTVLEYDKEIWREIVSLPRSKVHFKKYSFLSKFQNVTKSSKRTILTSRDPYSRLFAAYVDKILLPLHLMTHRRTFARNTGDTSHGNYSCPDTMSFQQFLDQIVKRAAVGGRLDVHWTPISSLCRPCEVKPLFLVKQETFLDDVSYVLEKLNVEKSRRDFLESSMHEKRSEFTVPGIVSTVFACAKGSHIEKCMTLTKLTERLWTAFQIQGFIDDSAKFPTEKIEKKKNVRVMDPKYVSKMILETISRYPMTEGRRKVQRHKHLCRAYQSIRAETLSGIRGIFKQDFRIFGYNETPPC